MKRILRSKGRTSTNAVETAEGPTVRRGLAIERDQTFASFPKGMQIAPSQVGGFFLSEPMLVIRQLISILDKVIQKPRSLSTYTTESYRDRCLIAAGLWSRIEREFDDDLKQLDTENRERLRRIWDYKIIPCAKDRVHYDNPEKDANFKLIDEAARKITKSGQGAVKHPEDFFGRLKDALWVTHDDKAAPKEIAEKIWEHLLTKEFKTNGEVRLGKGRLDEDRSYGLALARGNSVATSTKDPRRPRTPLTSRWGKKEVECYFGHDIAKSIFDSFHQKANQYFSGRLFGSMLYEHFGPIWEEVKEKHPDKENDYDKAVRDPIWALHSDVRRFYRELAKSKRFRVALKQFENAEEGDKNNLRKVLPDNVDRLLRILKAKDENAEVSHLIGMGKVIAHASEFDPAGVDNPDQDFQGRLNYFLTSQGQSEIKRNEAFARIWRNSVVFAHRSLQVWTASKPEKPPSVRNETDFDIYGKDVSVNAVLQHYTDEHYSESLAVLFGRRNNPSFENRTRASIFERDSSEQSMAILWGFLRLGGEIRNRTNHFSTKRRLTALLREGVVTGGLAMEGEYGSKANHVVADVSLDAFKTLLEFDVSLRAQAKADELQMMGFHTFVGDERSVLLHEVSKTNPLTVLALPSYRNLVRHVTKLAQFTEAPLDKYSSVFNDLDLSADALTRPGVNKFRDGVLQMLYRSGFTAWLADEGKDGGARKVHDALKEVTVHKRVRTEKTLQDRDWIHAHADTVIEQAIVEVASDLTDLMKQLASESMIEQRLNETYSADPKKQRAVAGKVEEFRQEVFAYLFGHYLTLKSFTWLFDELDEDPAAKPVGCEEMNIVDSVPNEDWHSQFYAWLYLLPIEHVVKLQQQLRKSRALDLDSKSGKEDAQLQSDLDQMDRLMSLLVQVQGAGFSGTEQDHLLETGALFYADNTRRKGEKTAYEKVISTDEELQGYKIPGSRRGLRQIAKFGNRHVLGRIFERHRVVPDEVEAFERSNTDAIKTLFSRKRDLNDQIIEACKMEGVDDFLPTLAKQYRAAATEATIHTFKAGGARLTDFTRLNQLLMRIVGRLTDYTLLWERDMEFLALGLFHRRITAGQGQLKLLTQDDDAAGCVYLGQNHGKTGRMLVWDPREGMVVTERNDLTTLIETDGQKLLGKFYYKRPAHSEDQTRHEVRNKEGRSTHTPKNHAGYKQIRNDFAHLNILHKGGILNLCYATNAVRSLFGYDRKLKNAVSQSIRKIVREEGLDISWTIEHDRLCKPEVIPCIETHLTMLRPRLAETHGLRFDLPRASVRYTSMVKALFEHDRGGYRAKIKERDRDKLKSPRKGKLTYPARFIMEGRDTVPDKILNLSYPEIQVQKTN